MKKFRKPGLLVIFSILLSVLPLLLLLNYLVNLNYQSKINNWQSLIYLTNNQNQTIENIYILAFKMREEIPNIQSEILKNISYFQKDLSVQSHGGFIFDKEKVSPGNKKPVQALIKQTESDWNIIKDKLLTILSTPVYIFSGNIQTNDSIDNFNQTKLLNPVYETQLLNIHRLKNEIVQRQEVLISKYFIYKNITEKSFRLIAFFIYFIILLYILLIAWFFYSFIIKKISIINAKAEQLKKGRTDIQLSAEFDDDFGILERSLDSIQQRLKDINVFVTNIGSGNYEVTYKSSGDEDELGVALNKMRDSYVAAEQENESRREAEEQENWITAGLAKFVDILRNSDKGIRALSGEIINNLISYLNAALGGLFMYIEEDEKEAGYLELIASYAYDRKKYISKRIEIGEGLIGTCFHEKQMIYLTEIPGTYINIASGLGSAKPRCILIIPLMQDENIFGVLELASFNEFKKHEIEFVQKLSANIATSLSTTAISERTSRLLIRAQEQAEELQAQEEEMRQNLEEMQATQEESHKRSVELHDIVEAINNSTATYELSNTGVFTHANNIYLNTIGHTEDEIVGSSHAELVGDNFTSTSLYNEFLSKLNRGIPQKKEILYMVRDQENWYSETYTPVHDDNDEVIKLLVVAHNITESKLHEKKVQESLSELKQKEEELNNSIQDLESAKTGLEEKEKFQTKEIIKLKKEFRLKENEFLDIIKFSDEGIIKTDSEGVILLFNETAQKILQLKESFVYNQKINEIVPALNDIKGTPQEITARIRQLSTGKNVNIEIDGISKSFWINTGEYTRGENHYFTFIFKDISNQVELESKLDEIRQQFETKEHEMISKINQLSVEKKTLKEEKIEHLTDDLEKGFIVWFSRYNLQIPEMDEQHKRIVKLINEFKDTFDIEKSASELNKLFKNFINYTSYHFHTEEKYFEEFNYSEAPEHKTEHKNLSDLFIEVQKILSGGNKIAVSSGLEKIKNDIIDHFTRTDTKYIEVFKKMRKG